MTARFKDGNPNNNVPKGLRYRGEAAPAHYAKILLDEQRKDPGKYFGGDLQGILEEVANIKKIGFTALWISPPLLQALVMNNGHTSYHGYWPKDWFSMDPHITNQGEHDWELFKLLVKKLHQQGIKIIVDFNFNHTSPVPLKDSKPHHFKFHEWGLLEQEGQLQALFVPPFISEVSDHQMVKTNWFHAAFQKSPPSSYCETLGIPFETCGDVVQPIYNLPDLNDRYPELINYFKAALNKWLEMDIDGLRIDTYRNISPAFIKEISSFAAEKFLTIKKQRVLEGKKGALASSLILIGEYYGAGEFDPGSIKLLNSIKVKDQHIPFFDFSLAESLRDVYSDRGGKHFNVEKLKKDSLAKDMKNKNNLWLGKDVVTFIDNHDQELMGHHHMLPYEKFAGCHPQLDGAGKKINREAAIYQAHLNLLTLRGIPTLYYATLQNLPLPCYPFQREGFCSRPMAQTSLGFELSDPKLTRLIQRISSLRQKIKDGHRNPEYNPVFREGDLRFMDVPSKNFPTRGCSSLAKTEFDRQDLVVAYERCTQDLKHCLLVVSSINFLYGNQEDVFNLKGLRFKAGTYLDLLTSKPYTIKDTLKVKIKNYESIVLIY